MDTDSALVGFLDFLTGRILQNVLRKVNCLKRDLTHRYWIILIPVSRVLFQTCCLREVRFVKIQPVRDIIRILHAKFLCRVRLLLQQLLYARVHILAERFLAKQET